MVEFPYIYVINISSLEIN